MVKISVRRHRGKLSLCWKVNGRRLHRVIKDAHRIDDERTQLAAELLVGKPAKQVKVISLSIQEQLEEFLQNVAVGAAGRGACPGEKHVEQGRRYISRVLAAGKITTVKQLDPGRIKQLIASFRRLSQKKFKNEAERQSRQAAAMVLSSASRNRHVGWCKQFSKWLFEQGAIETDALARLRRWPVKHQERHPRTRFEPHEITKLLEAANQASGTCQGMDGPSRAKLYLIALATGLRRKELAQLTPSSFAGLDTDFPVVRVRGAYTKNKECAEIGVHANVVSMLLEWLGDLQPHQPLFPGLEERKTNRMVQRDLKEAGVPYQTPAGEFKDFHALRHSHISLLWDIPGITPLEVQQQARHSCLAMTMRYSHLERERKNATARRLVLPDVLSTLGGSTKGSTGR